MEDLRIIFSEYIYHPVLDLYGAPILGFFLLILFVAETYRQLRGRTISRWNRIKTNIGVGFTAMLFLRIALIPALVFFAKWAGSKNIGFFHWLAIPLALEYILGFLLLDYGNYLWHVLNHRINFLWRFHNVHHIDLDLDLSTAIRFHFGEILFSIFFRGGIILLLGPSYFLVLIYEVFFEGATLFHHSNWKLPFSLEKKLSRVIVTPRMHGIHHSIVKRETDSNYAVIFNWWDRIHKTLRLNIPQEKINIGVPAYREESEQKFNDLLLLPLKKPRPWQLPDGSIPERINYNPEQRNRLEQ